MEYSYFTPLKMNENKTLKVFNHSSVENMNDAQLFIATAIQGLFARTEVTYYNGGTASYTALWLENLQDNYSVSVEYVTLDQMMQAYIERFGTEAGYALCELGTDSVNAATNACAALNALPATAATKEYLEAYGLVQKYDFTESDDEYYSSEERSFRLFKDKLNNKGLFSLDPERIAARDYAIAVGYCSYYLTDDTSLESLNFVGDLYEWVEEDSPVFGWGGIGEVTDVSRHSRYGLFTIACDWGYNWSVHACPAFYGSDDIRQNTVEEVDYEQKNVHTVCIVMSDGDNIQAVTNTLAQRQFYYAHNGGDFPMGYNISPSLAELGAGVLKRCYEMVGTSDYFVGAVSGQGYINPADYSNLDLFCSRMSYYLKKADLHSVQILDNQLDRSRLATYAKVTALKGVQVMLGDYYEEGKGSIYWEGDLPFVTCRVSLWRGSTTGSNAETAAQLINSFSTDVNDPEAYTLVNVHPWSMFGDSSYDTYQEVCKMVSLFNENVRVVTADAFFELLVKNVPHEDHIIG